MRWERMRQCVSAVGAVLLAGGLAQALPAPAWATGECARAESQDLAVVIRQDLDGRRRQDAGEPPSEAPTLTPGQCEILNKSTSIACEACFADRTPRACKRCEGLRQELHHLCP
jgi:hypothetical protein